MHQITKKRMIMARYIGPEHYAFDDGKLYNLYVDPFTKDRSSIYKTGKHWAEPSGFMTIVTAMIRDYFEIEDNIVIEFDPKNVLAGSF